MPAIFVSGTDTGVGKTVVTALLTRALRSLGVDCVAMKPLASGCQWRNGVLESEDATFLREVGDFEAPLDLICPVRLELPLAPLVAARQRGTETSRWPHLISESFQELQRHHEWVIVEGVGGWFVPLWQAESSVATCADLAASWQLPVLVVARRTLGTINHTILTCRAVENTARLLGVVFCDADAVPEDDIAADTSPQLVCELAGTRHLGFVGHSTDWSRGMEVLLPFARELISIR